MMFSLIATRHARADPTIDECTTYTMIDTLYGTQKLSSAKALCVKTVESFFISGINIVIKGMDINGKDLGTVQNAYGASATLNAKQETVDTFFKISTTKAEEQDYPSEFI